MKFLLLKLKLFLKSESLVSIKYNAEAVESGAGKVGYLVEFNDTDRIFNAPSQQATRDYVSGRFG